MATSILIRAGAQSPVPAAGESATPQLPIATSRPDAPISLDDRLREVEANLIGWALRVSKGNKSRAAELLKIKRSTLGDRIKHCGLDRPVVVPSNGAAAAAAV